MRYAILFSIVAALASVSLAGAAVVANPNDPGWPGEWGIRLIGIPQVWAKDAGTHPIIATVDTGGNSTFPDLKQVFVTGWNLVDNSAETSDEAGHGTDVALVIAANAGNSYGLAGTCPMCRVMPVKISQDGISTPKMIGNGIRWAADHGATVIVVSAAAPGGAPDPDEQAAVDYAGSKGAVILAAAGNDGATTFHYPAAMRGVVSIAGTDENDQLYSWSTRGNWVDLAAPGCIYGDTMCGTSYGPPLVAGAVGVLMSASKSITAVKAVNALRATAKPINGIGGGRIDVLAAAQSLGIMGPSKPTAVARPGVSLLTGKYSRRLKKTVKLGAGPVTIVLRRAQASKCTMALRSKSDVYLTWRTTPNELDISTTVAKGTYTVTSRCNDAKSRPYSLSIAARPFKK